MLKEFLGYALFMLERENKSVQASQEVFAYIDGQNLIRGIKSSNLSWCLHIDKFYLYLKRKFKISKAFYYIGVRDPRYKELYKQIRRAGFILKFRAHTRSVKSHKKGNVDVDIVLDICRTLYVDSNIKFLLITQDGDYYRLVKILIKQARLVRLIFPDSGRASKLYKNLHSKYWMNLSDMSIVKKIGYKC